MIHFNRGLGRYEFYRLKAHFEAHGEPSFQYTNDRGYWEEFVRRWWHHNNLSFENVRPTTEQQERLDEVNTWDSDNGIWQAELALYVETNAVSPETGCPHLLEKANELAHKEAYLEVVRSRLRATLASHRYKVEVGGYVLPNGVHLRTDREDQGMLNSAFQTLSQPFINEVDWKSPSGWVKVDLATITPLVQHCTYHVQCCFSAERLVDEALSAMIDHQALEEVDVKAQFDVHYQALLTAHLTQAQ